MDRTIRIGVSLMGGLAVVAAAVVALVLLLDVPFWVGLILLLVADVVLLVWAYVGLKVRQPT